MKILLTNDDGYNSTGINLLYNKLKKYGDVIILAPENVMSAKSTSITLGVGHELKKIRDDCYSFSGTPADCVAFALSMLNIDFDLVVSGCNDGWNISYDINYSGTIGACTQALIYRVPTIAFSCEHNFDLVDKEFDKVFDYLIKNNLLDHHYILNVNFPDSKEIKDIKLSHIFYREAKTFYKETKDGFLASRTLDDSYKEEIDTDVYLVHHECVSIVPLGRTSFDVEAYNILKKKLGLQK